MTDVNGRQSTDVVLAQKAPPQRPDPRDRIQLGDRVLVVEHGLLAVITGFAWAKRENEEGVTLWGYDVDVGLRVAATNVERYDEARHGAWRRT